MFCVVVLWLASVAEKRREILNISNTTFDICHLSVAHGILSRTVSGEFLSNDQKWKVSKKDKGQEKMLVKETVSFLIQF